MRGLILFLVGFLFLLQVHVSHAQHDSTHCRYNHQFRTRELISPTLLIATGTTLSATPTLHNGFDAEIRDWAQQDGHQRVYIDDYVQYAPVVSVYALKLCGLESKHSYRNITNLSAASYLFSFALTNGMKYSLRVPRPDNGVQNSFPSGHTSTAFAGAEILRREYGAEYPWVGVAGYGVATGVGLMRIYNNRHWTSDVLAGAGIGILSTCLSYWLAPYLNF